MWRISPNQGDPIPVKKKKKKALLGWQWSSVTTNSNAMWQYNGVPCKQQNQLTNQRIPTWQVSQEKFMMNFELGWTTIPLDCHSCPPNTVMLNFSFYFNFSFPFIESWIFIIIFFLNFRKRIMKFSRSEDSNSLFILVWILLYYIYIYIYIYFFFFRENFNIWRPLLIIAFYY